MKLATFLVGLLCLTAFATAQSRFRWRHPSAPAASPATPNAGGNANAGNTNVAATRATEPPLDNSPGDDIIFPNGNLPNLAVIPAGEDYSATGNTVPRSLTNDPANRPTAAPAQPAAGSSPSQPSGTAPNANAGAAPAPAPAPFQPQPAPSPSFHSSNPQPAAVTATSPTPSASTTPASTGLPTHAYGPNNLPAAAAGAPAGGAASGGPAQMQPLPPNSANTMLHLSGAPVYASSPSMTPTGWKGRVVYVDNSPQGKANRDAMLANRG